MDTIVQKQFERMEAALNALIDSIATFNPSPQAALDLVTADDDLSTVLDQLSLHQSNYTRIQTLRSESEALEAQLRASVATLADLRRELLDTEMTAFPEDARPVPSAQLLQYATNISKYTVPPTYREAIPKAEPESEKDKDKEDALSSGVPSTGQGTPALGATTSALVEPPKDAIAITGEELKIEVTPEQTKWLEEMRAKGMMWAPWPDDNKIRGGNLMMIQHLLDQKKDPWTDRVPTLQQVEEAARREEEARKEEEEEKKRVEQETGPRRESVVAGPRPEPQQVQQFTGFEFDDDDY